MTAIDYNNGVPRPHHVVRLLIISCLYSEQEAVPPRSPVTTLVRNSRRLGDSSYK